MNFRQKITLCLLLYMTLCSPAFAQVVEIPDPNLRRAVREALELPIGTPISRGAMVRLTRLGAGNREITDFTGLEFATALKDLLIWNNPITDLTPIAGLINLEHISMAGTAISDLSALSNLTALRELHAPDCQIVDIGTLANLKQLVTLNLRGNRITDVSPLANLTQLKTLELTGNQIVDVRPLSNLTSLYELDISNNLVTDHSSLDGLPLTHFNYDQFCEMPPLPLEPRLDNRTYPSVMGAEWTFDRDSRLDLIYGINYFAVHWRNDGNYAGDVPRAIEQRDDLLASNPNMVFLVNVHMRSEAISHHGEDWPYWIRDANGNIAAEGFVPGWGLMDFTHPHVQDYIVSQAIAISKCGLFDGIVFDWWSEIPVLANDQSGWSPGFRGLEAELEARQNIIRRIRANTRSNFLIQVNSNLRQLPITGPYINGLNMESGIPEWYYRSDTRLNDALRKARDTLIWSQQHMRTPHITGIVGRAFEPPEPTNSEKNRRWVRALTTLVLTHSDGYIEYAGHDHEKLGAFWYDFLKVDLGHPVSEETAKLYENREGLYIREYTNGWAVYNHSGSPQVITLPEEAQGVASGLVNTEHELPNLDGEMYLRKTVVSDQLPVVSENAADVNGDGVVNILDLVLVAQGISGGDGEGDVNGDGVVNVFDLVQVAGAIGGGGAAPSASSLDPSMISASDIESWLAGAQGLGVGDANFQRGIRFLEGLLAALTPKETTLLPNFPNPFNPETWIPYRLAREAEVAITIYDTKGTLVRRLALGNQEAGYYAARGKAGYYAARGKAAYWDGRNERGETVVSGIYIYQFRAGDYAASRRMVIVK